MKQAQQSSSPRMGIFYTEPGQKKRAELLARTLEVPIITDSAGLDIVLTITRDRLSLSIPGSSAPHALVYAEFVKGPAGYRRKRSSREMLLRAIGLRRDQQLSVLDATGGLGKDSFLMAGSGCTMHVLERNPVVAALLQDGLRRASEHTDTREIAARITFSAMDAIQYLRGIAGTENRFDVVYLDPMYPARNKSRLVKKEMQMLQELIGHEPDTEQLLNTALAAAGKRVVVKRPRTAPSLGDIAPSHSIKGKTTRFDVYMI
ncbi:MAG: class I SAM-dependent methyltransferase [Desulfobulbaceae bacterium]|nr:class I SAM-dependent methyltransferase [Desulfobulbaceae bacterium]